MQTSEYSWFPNHTYDKAVFACILFTLCSSGGDKLLLLLSVGQHSQ